MSALTAARARHPSARTPPLVAQLRERVEDAMGLAGAAHPEVASAILAVRGVSGMDRVDFARRAGVDVTVLISAERGEMSRSMLPGSLRPMVPR